MDKKTGLELLNLIFSPAGFLQQLLASYEERPGQQRMAEQVLEAYLENRVALVEAGTGIGKSLAYLANALLFVAKEHEKTVISTHTIALQQQLIEKDIPFLLQALDLQAKVVIVKGMQNYLCLRRLEEVEDQMELLPGMESVQFEKLSQWANATTDGSRSQISFPLLPSVWNQVCVDADSCTKMQCPHFRRCFFFKARKEVEDAQLLIVNHHLLLYDLQNKEKADRAQEHNILPTYKRLIIDEAHHLEEVALDVLAERVDRLDLLRLLGRVSSENAAHKGRLQLIREILFEKKPVHTLLLQRLEIDLPIGRREIGRKIEIAFSLLEQVGGGQKWRVTTTHLQNPLFQQSLLPAFQDLGQELQKWTVALDALATDLQGVEVVKERELEELCTELSNLSGRLAEKGELLQTFFEIPQDDQKGDQVSWVEQNRENLILVRAYLDIASRLRSQLFSPISTVALCSATLTTGGHFRFVRQRLGLVDEALTDQSQEGIEKRVSEGIHPSPFAFEERVLFAVVRDLPDPTRASFCEAAAEAIIEIIAKTKGGAFVLFTSYEMLRTCYQITEGRLQAMGLRLFKQGDISRNLLLEGFKKGTNSVLFGTDSFWEGVDVAGEALRCVVLVRIPFQVPNDPLVEAQHEAVQKEGKNPFFDFTIPKAIVKFKQGFGRLMRRKEDRGCVVCLDHRLITKPYGKQFLKSLPPCQILLGSKAEVLDAISPFTTV